MLLGFLNIGYNTFDKLFKLLFIQLLILPIAFIFPQLFQVNILGIYLKSYICQHFFKFVLQFLMAIYLGIEKVLKNGMGEQFVPTYTLLFCYA